MNNNELLKKMTDTMKLSNEDVSKIFGLGDLPITADEVPDIFEDYGDDQMECTNLMLESFLNGLIVYKRGPKETKPGENVKPKLAIDVRKNRNNVVLKKLKIVFSLTSEGMLDLINHGEVDLHKHDLSAMFRKQGHKHYKSCPDYYVKEFLAGIAKQEQ